VASAALHFSADFALRVEKQVGSSASRAGQARGEGSTASQLQRTRSDAGTFPTHLEVTRMIATLEKQAAPEESMQSAELDPLPVSEPVKVSWEQQAHRGDWIGFMILIGCFLLVGALHALDLIGGFFWR
jgi:hypothetical protein